MFKVIIIAADGSEASDRALALAIEMAQPDGTHFHVINVPQDETSALVMSGAGDYIPMTPPLQHDDLKAIGAQVVNKARSKFAEAGLSRVSPHVRIGSAAKEVLSLAEEVNADLIVTGRRGLGGIASFVLGSTSHAILNGATCACLSVP